MQSEITSLRSGVTDCKSTINGFTSTIAEYGNRLNAFEDNFSSPTPMETFDDDEFASDFSARTASSKNTSISRKRGVNPDSCTSASDSDSAGFQLVRSRKKRTCPNKSTPPATKNEPKIFYFPAGFATFPTTGKNKLPCGQFPVDSTSSFAKGQDSNGQSPVEPSSSSTTGKYANDQFPVESPIPSY